MFWPSDSEEDEGEDSEAGGGPDADTLESISVMEECLEELAQARSLLKAADGKVRGLVHNDKGLQTPRPLPGSCPDHALLTRLVYLAMEGEKRQGGWAA